VSKKHLDKKQACEIKIVYAVLLVVLLALGIFLVHTQQQSGPIIWDEAVYLANARDHIATSHFTEDFRFPLLEYLIATVWLVTGESILMAQLLMISITLASVFILFLLSKKILHNHWLALLVSTIYATSGLLVFWGFRIYNDILATTFMLLAIYFYLNKTKPTQDYLVGIMTGLVFLTRFPAIIFAIILGTDLLRKQQWKRLWRISAGGLLTLLPWLIGNTISHGNPIWDLLAQQDIITTYAPWQKSTLFFLNMNDVFGITLLFLIPFIIYLVYTKTKQDIWMLITGIVGINILYYAFFTQMKFPRYLLLILPFMSLLIVKGMHLSISAIRHRLKQTTYTKKARQRIVIVASIVLMLILFVHAGFGMYGVTKEFAWISYCQEDGAIQQSISHLTATYPEKESIISNYWTVYGYYGNFDMMSLWTTNMTAIFSKTNATLVVYVQQRGLPYPEEILSENDQFELIEQFKDQCEEQVTIYKVRSH
jgi:hypothetical protein